jgi:nucleotide-binding universal stress UspA family protein
VLVATDLSAASESVVMGSQGRGFLAEVFLGSVSHQVVRRSPVPVLLVPAGR